MAFRILPFATRISKKWWTPTFIRNSSSIPKSSPGSTVDTEEVGKFTDLADQWWGKPYATLRSMNAIRVPLIRDGLHTVAGVKTKKPLPLEGYKIIDIGCGGGILAEPLARLGANVTGLDPGQENIDVAVDHASRDVDIKERLTYVCDTVENYVKMAAGEYDALVCSEVVEHVADVKLFVDCCVGLTKEGGSLFFTTINRTVASYLISILGGEYVLKVIPKGTHEWNKFVPPEELSDILRSWNCRIVSVEGVLFNPITKSWSFSSFTQNMYALHAVK